MNENKNELNYNGKVSVNNLAQGVEYQGDSIIMKMVAQETSGNLLLFIIDKGQGLIEHSASSDAYVYIIEGKIDFTLFQELHELKGGDLMNIPAKAAHTLIAKEKTKMLLVVLS